MAKLSRAQVNALMVCAYYLPDRGAWHGTLGSLLHPWRIRYQTALCLCRHGVLALSGGEGRFTGYSLTPGQVALAKRILARNAF